MGERRSMQVGDWFNAAINLVIGVLLGSAANGFVQLATTAFWPLAVVIPLLFAVVFLFSRVLDVLTERLFTIGVRPARKPKEEGRIPLPRLLSLPAGLVLGVALARLGQERTLARGGIVTLTPIVDEKSRDLGEWHVIEDG